ncbi:AAA family ATPase [Limnothrix sp. FACHB-406]|uniref:AAA family ATPase n=1 Tax=Limnothrix sp. FACHB-406 TaxID=2692817 RepID=UPI001684CD2D|nr:AAA family ATPase [Limnothrix sp. FACHB-406]
MPGELGRMAFGVAGGVALGVAGGVAGGVAVGVAGGVAVGVAVGVGGDVAVGVAFTIGWPLGIFRIYWGIFAPIWSLILDRFIIGNSVAAAIPYFPYRLDEIIYFPLPFLNKNLIRLYQESPQLGKRELEYLLEFTNQKSRARQVMKSIAALRLAACRNVQDIEAVSQEIAWIPAQSFDDENSEPDWVSDSFDRMAWRFSQFFSQLIRKTDRVNPILLRFLELAGDIRATNAATSPYRQQQNLEWPKQALEALTADIAALPDRALIPDLLRAARQWQQAIQDLQDRLSEAAQRTGELPNPYSPNASLIDTAAVQQFRGRRDVFQELENLAQASSPPMLLLWGNRRMGKSWALNYLPRCLNSEIVPLRVDLQGSAGSASSLAGFARNLAQDITRAADQARNLRLPPPNAQALQDDPFSALQHWFSEIERRYPNRRFWLCLDEYERLEELINTTGSRAPLNFFRYIFQNRRAWTLLFCGSHDPNELNPYWSDYLINTRTVKVSYLSEADSRDLIIKPEPQRDFPEIYDPAAVDRIWHWTAGHPYWTQNLCFEVVQLLNHEQRRRATVDDVDRALDRATGSGDTILREFWSGSLTASQRAALTQLLTQQPLRPEDDRPLQKLLHKEILRPDPNSPSGYRLWVPLYHHHLTTAQPWRDRP